VCSAELDLDPLHDCTARSLKEPDAIAELTAMLGEPPDDKAEPRQFQETTSAV
jgi:hypothetical protein